MKLESLKSEAIVELASQLIQSGKSPFDCIMHMANELLQIIETSPAFCEHCRCLVDWSTCWCGYALDDHNWKADHPYVPSGCRCKFVTKNNLSK